MFCADTLPPADTSSKPAITFTSMNVDGPLICSVPRPDFPSDSNPSMLPSGTVLPLLTVTFSKSLPRPPSTVPVTAAESCTTNVSLPAPSANTPPAVSSAPARSSTSAPSPRFALARSVAPVATATVLAPAEPLIDAASPGAALASTTPPAATDNVVASANAMAGANSVPLTASVPPSTFT